MWEYKVVTGTYSIDGASVIIKNPAGEGTLQQALDVYGADRWELVHVNLDGVQREAVLVLKRPKGGAGLPPLPPAMTALPAPPPPMPARAQGFADADGEVVRRRGPGSPPAGNPRATPAAPPPSAPSQDASGKPRRSRRDLDKLMREE
jgi:hypothetical protein